MCVRIVPASDPISDMPQRLQVRPYISPVSDTVCSPIPVMCGIGF